MQLCMRAQPVRHGQVGRPFRFMRGFRLVRYVAGLAEITRTLWLSLPSMMSIITLIAITTFFYASAPVWCMHGPYCCACLAQPLGSDFCIVKPSQAGRRDGH